MSWVVVLVSLSLLGCGQHRPTTTQSGGGAALGGGAAGTVSGSAGSGVGAAGVAGGGTSTGAAGTTGAAGGSAAAGTSGGAGGGAAGAAGSVGTGGTGSGCGSRGLGPCPGGQFCEFPAGTGCGAADGGGHCQTKPQICTEIYAPVCGCDGTTYASVCTAQGAGISVAHDGECGTAIAPNDCDPRKVLCKIAQPTCPAGQVPSVAGSCYGPCVGIETCHCAVAAACPNPNQFTCLLSGNHCSPFL